jgi:hypothetical protein
MEGPVRNPIGWAEKEERILRMWEDEQRALKGI